MYCRLLKTLIVAVALSAVPPTAGSAGQEHGGLALSAGLRALLLAEMRELAGGAQAIAFALAGADWEGIEATSARIRASYILEQRLSEAQRHELERALPEGFKQRDQEFHERAAKLGAAAARRDAELTAFHYSRLLEGCAACHAAYAPERFPGFVTEVRTGHGH